MRTARTVLFVLALGLSTVRSAPAQPTMSALWPNQDGLAWDYAQHYESYGPNPQTVDNQIRIFFDGVTVAPDNIQAQYLRQSVLSGPARMAASDGAPDSPLLRQLWIARPDLRAKIRQRLDDAPCPEYAPQGSYSLFLNGEFAWVKSAADIVAWRCNLPNTKSWQWLVSDLTLGNTFTLQLVPDLADDVFLHGTIAAIDDAAVPAGTFQDCVRVDYVVDYGSSQCTNQNGDPVGTFRSESRGSVWYAPDVGPVESHEEFIPFVEQTGGCGGGVGQAASSTSLQLLGATVPVRHTSWGRLKTVYR